MGTKRLMIAGGLVGLMLVMPAVVSAATYISIAPAPTKLGSVAVLVEDTAGKAVPDAQVSIWNADGKTVAKGTTDSSGKYGVKLPTGTYGVAAGKQTFPSGQSGFSVSPGKTTEVKVKIDELDAKFGAVAGMVLNVDGMPVADAKIMIRDTKTGKTFEGSTDANGAFRFELPAGTYDLYAGKIEFPSGKASFGVEEGKTTDLKLQINE